MRSADFPVRSNVLQTRAQKLANTLLFFTLLRTGKSALRTVGLDCALASITPCDMLACV